MAEEAAAAEEQQSSPLVKTLIGVGIIVLVSAILAAVTFQFVIRPLVAPAAAPEAAPPTDLIPPTAVSFDFPEMQATVLTDDPGAAAPLLMFQLSLLCANAETVTVIQSRQSLFVALVNKLHRNRTRSELNDPYVQESLLRNAEQEINALLGRLAVDGSAIRVMQADYLKFTIYDL